MAFDKMKMMTRWTIALLLAACVSVAAQQEAPPANNASASTTVRGSRMLKLDDELGKAYFQTYQSIEAAERFIREHPGERDLCAGALINIAALRERQDKKKAIEAYQKAITEYADEIVPDKNASFTVANWALFRIARLERDTGNREKSLEILGKLMTSADANTRTSSRIEYLATKQAHLKVLAEVSIQGKGPFSLGTRIPVVVSLKNLSKEAVTFMCYARIEHREHRSYHALTPREGCEEITLEPGGGRDVPMVFTEKDTQGIESGLYNLEASLTGIPFDSDSKSLKIEKTEIVPQSPAGDILKAAPEE